MNRPISENNKPEPASCETDACWVLCPFCGSKTRTKLLPDTELRQFPLFCPKCKREVIVNAAHQKITIIHSALQGGKQ